MYFYGNTISVIAAELKQTRHLLDKRDKEVLVMKEHLQAKELEMDDIRAAAAANEIALKESFEVEGRLLQEEIASLKQIMKGTVEPPSRVALLLKSLVSTSP